VLVPIAGAAEPPNGWLVAALSALALLALAVLRPGVRWGWLLLVAAGTGLAMPRGSFSVVGPALFVATAMCLTLWLANRRSRRRRGDVEPRADSPERAAQLALGISGERHVGHVLARELPQEFALINGLTLPRGAGDIDHLVVGPSGVFLLETKTMAGRIICEPDGTWRRTRVGRAGTAYAAYIGDPAAQVQRNIFAVRECLRRRQPQLLRRMPLWIEGLVVFPHPRTELETENSRVPAVLLDQAAARICLHVPPMPLRPADVDAILKALLEESQHSFLRQTAQALVEVALVVPLALALVLGTVAVSRLIQAQGAVVAVAHEAARAGALGRSPQDAIERMRERAQVVAPGLGLDARAIMLDWDVSAFAQDPGRVVSGVRYQLDFHDLPLAGWVPPQIVRAEHVEWVDPYRSGVYTPTEQTD